MAARGLWVTCGSWCGKQLTDGVISDRRVRQLGGTRTQIKALVDSGLWVAFVDESGAKCYRFHDWFDMNPSRESVHESREREREKKREWRDRKAAKQGKRENVPGGQDRGQDRGHFRPSPGVSPSTRPDPSRPDLKERGEKETGDAPVGFGGIDSPPLVSDERGGAAATSGGFAAYGSPDDPRCVKHKDLPRGEVPACRDCARAREVFEAQVHDAKQARRAAIDACPWCDDNGMAWPVNAVGDTVAVRCDHVRVPVAPPPPAPFQSWRSKK